METENVKTEEIYYLLPIPPEEVAGLLNMPGTELGMEPVYLPESLHFDLMDYARAVYTCRYPAFQRLVEAHLKWNQGDAQGEKDIDQAVMGLYRQIAQEYIATAPQWLQASLANSGGPGTPTDWLPPVDEAFPNGSPLWEIAVTWTARLRQTFRRWLSEIRQTEENGHYYNLGKRGNRGYRLIERELDRERKVRELTRKPTRLLSDALRRAGYKSHERAKLLDAITGEHHSPDIIRQWDKRLKDYLQKNLP